MKNIDKIRQMNSEELAHCIYSCVYCIYHLKNCYGKSCIEGTKQWLEQEVEE